MLYDPLILRGAGTGFKLLQKQHAGPGLYARLTGDMGDTETDGYLKGLHNPYTPGFRPPSYWEDDKF